MKQRFSALDVRATVAALNERIIGLRLQGIYDVNPKTFLFKFTKPEHKELVLVESGIRMHTTSYTRDKSIVPSSFCMKLRKHLRARRVTAVRQIGMDRVVDFEFAVVAGPQAEGTYHIICEFYASGNIILTDYQYNILALLRVVHLDDEVSFAVGQKYSLAESRDIEPVGREELVDRLSKAGPKENLKRCLATFGAYGPALSEHVILRAKLSPSLRVATALDLNPQSPQINALLEAYREAYEIVVKLGEGVHPGYITFLPNADGSEGDVFDEFDPWLFEQHREKPHKAYDSFADAADVFFSNIEAQRLKIKAQQQEIAAAKKLEAIKSEHDGRVASLEHAHRKTEEQARRIELNLEFVDQAIMVIRQAVAAGIDWKELEELVDDQREQGNPVAERIRALNLSANQITLQLDDPTDWDDSDNSSDSENEDGDGGVKGEFSGPLDVDVDIFQSAFANAQRYYNSRRQAGIKHAKTLAVSTQALQSAEQKIKADLKATKITSSVSQLRKPFWFEKFSWFISSDGYLVVAGRDMQQNELLVKRHLKPGDAYVHADIHGAASVIVKNKLAAAPEATSAPSAESIPPSTLFQAGIMSVCQSRAWDAKIVTSAWWVEARQVSKTAPTGEYLTTGSFMIRGKKHFLPPTQLVYGFGFLFRLADDESVSRHANARHQRLAIMEENRRAALPGEAGGSESDNDEDSFTIVSGATEALPKDANKPGASIDFDAVRAKYNLDEIESAAVDDFGAEEATPRAQGTGKRAVSAKERRDQRKNKKQGGATGESDGTSNVPTGKLSKKEQRRLLEEQKFEKSQQQQQQQQQKRGKKGKIRKMKEKYAEQDEEDRELRMALLGARGKDVDQILENSRGGALRSDEGDETSHSDSQAAAAAEIPPSAQHPMSIVDQLKALSTKDPQPAATDADAADRQTGQETALQDDAEEDDAPDVAIEQLNVLDTLTPAPLPGDNLSFAIPVCAPYSALSSYKYRVKLVPGVMKKGKACKMALTLATILANREKELMKGVSDIDMIAQMLGKVKVTAPNMESIRQK
ncbi:DUF814-domain-containing protein, partial [Martensiomyces pterosporus]